VKCKDFDAQVAHPKGKLKSLQKQFIRLRIVDMKDVDIGLFHFDFDTTFAIFVLNHKEQIYLRYGSHDDQSTYSFLSIKSLNYALEQGLDLHKSWKSGAIKVPDRPKKKLSQSYPEVKKIVNKGKCVHCHNVASSEHRGRTTVKGFEKKKHVWVYPDPAKFGLILDPNTGNKIKKVDGVSRSSGLKRSDVIKKINDTLVHTFTDIQYALHKLPMEATKVSLTVLRKRKELKIEVNLPEHWRVTDINKRSMGHILTPFPGFWSKSVPSSRKKKWGLKKSGFASEVTKFWVNTNGKKAGMRVGDIVYEVDGVQQTPLAHNAMIHIRLNYKPGDTIQVKVLRGGKKLGFSYKLKKKPY
jgi:hypothetical protein